MPESQNGDDLVIVFVGDFSEAGMVKGLLEDAGIEAFLKDEYVGIVAPWTVTGGGVGAVKVVIARRDLESAQTVLEEYASAQAAEEEPEEPSSS